MPEAEIGVITDFFVKPLVAGVTLSAPIKLGDRLHIVGHTTDFEITVDSMQIDRAEIQSAGACEAVGIKVPDRVRKGDTVYKVT